MSSLLSNLADNLASKVNACIDYKLRFGFMNVKDGLLIFDFSESKKIIKRCLIKIWQKNLRININSVIEVLTNFV